MNYSDEFWEGYKAYQNNMSRLDNAYDRDSQEHIDWDEGWCQAAQDD